MENLFFDQKLENKRVRDFRMTNNAIKKDLLMDVLRKVCLKRQKNHTEVSADSCCVDGNENSSATGSELWRVPITSRKKSLSSSKRYLLASRLVSDCNNHFEKGAR